MPCVPCRLRDLNDEINKLLREKGHWERRIVELGGPDYALTRAAVTDSEGREVLGGATGKGSGYRCAPGSCASLLLGTPGCGTALAPTKRRPRVGLASWCS